MFLLVKFTVNRKLERQLFFIISIFPTSFERKFHPIMYSMYVLYCQVLPAHGRYHVKSSRQQGRPSYPGISGFISSLRWLMASTHHPHDSKDNPILPLPKTQIFPSYVPVQQCFTMAQMTNLQFIRTMCKFHIEIAWCNYMYIQCYRSVL